jgi:SIR2-like domain
MAQIIKRLGIIGSSEIPSYREAIVKLIIETIEHSMKFNFENTLVYAPESYAALMTFISKGPFKSNTSIITFNYDLGIDTAISRANYNVRYGFEETNEERNDFNLFKLHGSINWAISEKDLKVYPYYPKWYLKDLTVQMNLNQRGTTKLFVSKFLHKILDHNPGNYTLKEESLIVPPTWNKNSYHGTISKVWEEAALKLVTAKRIYVFGYSLPETDSFFRYLFALGTLSPTRIRRIIVANPEPVGGDVDRRFQSLIGESILSRYKYLPQKFSLASDILNAYS